MNDRKRAMQIVYRAIEQRAVVDPRDDWRDEIETTIDTADNVVDLIANLATFGATFAFALGGDSDRVMSVVNPLRDSVMHEDDDGPPSFL